MYKELDFKYRYSTGGESSPIDFFSKALSCGIQFDLGLGFFSSASINVLSVGFAKFISNGGNVRLYINQYLSEEDYNIIIENKQYDNISEHLLSDFNKLSQVLSKRDKLFFDCLSYLITNKRIDIKIVVPKFGGIAHQKFGIFTDAVGDKISFSGSLNFTASALLRNIETIECDYSWKSIIGKEKIEESERDFNAIFMGNNENVITIDAPDFENAIIQKFPVVNVENILTEEEEIIKEIQNSFPPKQKDTSTIPHFPYPTGARKYQEKAYASWIKNDYNGIFAMATGTGKTITSLNCVLEEYHKTNKYRVLILVPSIDLVNQWIDEVEKFNFTNILPVSSHHSWRKELTELKNDSSWGIESNFIIVSTYKSFENSTFQSAIKELSKDMILIADEAHNVGSAGTRSFFEKLEIKRRIALSATPKRNYDEEGTTALEHFFNDSPPYCYSYSLKQAIYGKDDDEGETPPLMQYPKIVYLSKNEMSKYAVLTKRLLRYFDSSTGKFKDNPEVQKLLMDRKRIIHKAEDKYRVFGNILDELYANSQLNYCFVYVPEGSTEGEFENEDERIINRMSQIVHDKYPILSINTYIGGDNQKKERLRAFAEGKINMLFAMKCLDEGVDVPRAEIGIFASSTGNPRQFIQRRGRLLRRHPDKTFAKIYDMIVVPNFESIDYDDDQYSMEKSMVKNELIRVSYFASLSSNYYENRNNLKELLDFYNFEISTLIKELDEQ